MLLTKIIWDFALTHLNQRFQIFLNLSELFSTSGLQTIRVSFLEVTLQYSNVFKFHFYQIDNLHISHHKIRPYQGRKY